jgi:hypothetical protein
MCRKAIAEQCLTVDSSRQGLSASYHMFDACTDGDYAFCCALMYHPNKNSHTAYVRTYTAPKPPKKAPRLAGSEKDFKVPLQRFDITKDV